MNIEKMINERLPLILSATLISCAIIVVLVLLPMTDHIKALQRQESLMFKDSRQVNSLVKKRERNSTVPKLLTLKDASTVVEEIAAAGRAHSIVFLSMSSQEKSKSFYKKINALPVDLETQSTYQQLALFMDGLNNLTQGIVLVDSFQVIRDTQELDKVKSKMHVLICLKDKVNGKK